jgi:CHASE3 domain sensor protein
MQKIPPRKTKKLLFWLGISLPTLALVAMTWLVYQSGGRFNNSFNWVLHSYKVMDLFQQTQAHMVDAEANQRGYLLTGREEYLELYQTAMQTIRSDLAELKSFTRVDPAQQANIALLETFVTEELEFDPAKVLPINQNATSTAVVKVTESGKQKIERVRRVLFQVHEDEQQALSRHQQAAEADVISGQIMSLVLIVAVAVALVLVLLILMRLERLQQFVTICAWTGQVKFQGEWLRLDEYLQRQFGISVSHSLSQEAATKMKREIEELNRRPNTPPPPAV